MKSLIAVLVILFCLLQYQLWFAPGGALETWHINKSLQQQKSDNDHLQERNAVLEADVQDLRQGSKAIEGRARKNLGMIKKGETFYQIVQ